MENDGSLMNVHTDGDVEYYSIPALDEMGEIEQYILAKTFDDNEEDNADLFRICALFDFNFNKILTIKNFCDESTGIISVKDIEVKNFTEANKDICALSTNARRTPIIIKSKNIENVIVYDPTKKVIALAAISMHQTLDKALKSLVLELNIKYNSNPMDLKVAVISFGHSKVDVNEDTLDIFKSNFHNISHSISQTEMDVYQVDLTKINVATLLEIGVKYENITMIRNKDLLGILGKGETVYTIINIK